MRYKECSILSLRTAAQSSLLSSPPSPSRFLIVSDFFSPSCPFLLTDAAMLESPPASQLVRLCSSLSRFPTDDFVLFRKALVRGEHDGYLAIKYVSAFRLLIVSDLSSPSRPRPPANSPARSTLQRSTRCYLQIGALSVSFSIPR